MYHATRLTSQEFEDHNSPLQLPHGAMYQNFTIPAILLVLFVVTFSLKIIQIKYQSCVTLSVENQNL